jgi:DNA-binding GntR family transcriptional regulator
MFLFHKPLGVEALARATAYSKGTVEDSLDALSAMGLVVKTSRYNGWQLTSQGYQLPLFDPDNFPKEGEAQSPEERESQNLRLPEQANTEVAEVAQVLEQDPAGQIESQNLRLPAEGEPAQLELAAGAEEIESQNLRLDLEGGPETEQPAERESQNLRLPTEEEGGEGQKINVESQNLRLPADMHVLKHVVVLDSDSSTESLKQQHEHESGAPARAEDGVDEIPEKTSVPEVDREAVIQAAAEIFRGDGASAGQAKKSATNLVEEFGAAQVAAQLEYFPRRCEIAKKSKRGLDNASGLFVRSVKENYPPPAKEPEHSTWYSQVEYEQLIDH